MVNVKRPITDKRRGLNMKIKKSTKIKGRVNSKKNVEGRVVIGTIPTHKTELLILFTYEDAPSAEYKEVEKLLKTEFEELRSTKEFTGKKMTASLLRTPNYEFKKLLLVGLGKQADCDLEVLRRGAGTAVKIGREYSESITIPLLSQKRGEEKGLDEAVQSITEGALLGNYRFTKYKTQGLEEIKELKKLTFLVEKERQIEKTKIGLERGLILSNSTNYVRDLVMTPATDLDPAALEKEAKKLSKKHGLGFEVFNSAELKKRKMEGLLAVGRGSAIPPRMIILHYKRPGAKKHLIFCGKGVCYDSGGYNIKSKMMEEMKDDMGGAGALLGMLDSVATLNLKTNVTLVIGAVENMINARAYKPGDIIKASNGKTIEVANTDAEGRIVLADCLSYASTLKHDELIDIATLTGSAIAALGHLAGAILSPNDSLAEDLVSAGEDSGDRLWRMPLWEDHKAFIKSDVADVKNIGTPASPGIMDGAVFLQEFVKDPKKWAHIDIGGAVFEENDRDYIPKGATGWGVRILTLFVERKSS